MCQVAENDKNKKQTREHPYNKMALGVGAGTGVRAGGRRGGEVGGSTGCGGGVRRRTVGGCSVFFNCVFAMDHLVL